MKNSSKDVLVQLIPGAFVIPGITNIGVIFSFNNSIDTTEVYLIDTGSSSAYGNGILRALQNHFEPLNQKYIIKAIINTHSHSDHIGGNFAIQQATECQIWMSYFESNLSEISLTHSAIIYGGNTVDEIANHASVKEPVKTDRIISFDDEISLSTGKMTFISLAGHSFNDLGIIFTGLNGERILFAGDSIFTCSDPNKHPIHFMLHPEQFTKTLDKIAAIENLKICVPGHGEIITENIQDKVDYCKKNLLELKESILDCIKQNPCSTEQIIKAITLKFNIHMGFVLYHLVGCSIKAVLGDLKNQKLIYPDMQDNELLWTIRI